MSPLQAVILPMNDELTPYALEVKERFDAAGLRTEVDSRTESLNKKIREAQIAHTPLILTIGAREKEAGTLAVRTLDGKVAHGVTHERFIDTVLGNIGRRAIDFEGFFAQ
jgi:threonyl-tRNA synthetase